MNSSFNWLHHRLIDHVNEVKIILQMHFNKTSILIFHLYANRQSLSMDMGALFIVVYFSDALQPPIDN